MIFSRSPLTLGVIFLALSTVAPAQAADLTHLYTLNSTLTDSLGGPNLISAGGVLPPTGSYTFNANQGLSLSNAINPTNYSILIDFSFDTTTSFRKIVDFKALSGDDGLYNLNSFLNFFPTQTGPANQILLGTLARVVITRDGTSNLVTGYVNGVQQIQFADSSSIATFSATNNIINFFQDDSATSGREASSGSLSQIAIYEGALTTQDAAFLGGPNVLGVPEPSQLLGLLSLGIIGGVASIRRRRFSKPTAHFSTFR